MTATHFNLGIGKGRTRNLCLSLLVVAISSTLSAISGCSDRSSPTAAASNALPAMHGDQTIASVDANLEKSSSANGAAAKEEPKFGSAEQPTRDISFDNIKFEMLKEEAFQRKMITPAIERLSNSKIRIRGYILPSFQQTGLAQFVLVRDNMQCCFGPGAALYDCIVVEMDSGKTTDFTNRPVAVEGVFSIREIKGSDDRCLAIYHLQAGTVQ